jgi:CRISPR-associated protein Cas1
MILYNKVLTAVNRAGLDPALSCLHSIAPRRMSLALDLMEEFRAIICDSAVLKLVNTFSVGKDDFFKNSFDGGVTMTSLAISRLVDAIETRLSDSTLYPRLSRKLEYRNIIQWQAWHYRDCVMDEEKNYEPFKIR